MNIILSTGNIRKAEEIRAVFAGSQISILSLADVGIKGEAIEDGNTLEQNASKKAQFAHQACGGKHWSMADDTGIFIDALGGKPGVNKVLWPYERPSTQAILAELKDVPSRVATFKTVVAVISPDGREFFFEGAITGSLLENARKEAHPRMPYSTIFVPDGHTKSWSEMTLEEENTISHRGKAFRRAREFLENLRGA